MGQVFKWVHSFRSKDICAMSFSNLVVEKGLAFCLLDLVFSYIGHSFLFPNHTQKSDAKYCCEKPAMTVTVTLTGKFEKTRRICLNSGSVVCTLRALTS